MKTWKNPEILELDVKATEMWLFSGGSDGPLSDTVQDAIGVPVGEVPDDYSPA